MWERRKGTGREGQRHRDAGSARQRLIQIRPDIANCPFLLGVMRASSSKAMALFTLAGLRWSRRQQESTSTWFYDEDSVATIGRRSAMDPMLQVNAFTYSTFSNQERMLMSRSLVEVSAPLKACGKLRRLWAEWVERRFSSKNTGRLTNT